MRGALGAADGKHLHLAVFEMAGNGRQRGVQKGDLPTEERRHRLPGALVRHMHDVDAEAGLERLGGEVMDAADAGGAVVQLARLLLRERHQLLQRVRGHRGMRDQVERRGADQAHRREILERLVGQLGEEMRVDRDLADVGDQQRVAVGRRLHDLGHAIDAARAAHVLHHDRLAQRIGELAADQARHRVGKSAGRVRHDDPDRARRIVLRVRGARDEQCCEDRYETHRFSSRPLSILGRCRSSA